MKALPLAKPSRLDVFSASAAAGDCCFLLKALKGYNKVAQANEGQEPLTPLWVTVPTNFLLSPRIGFWAIRGGEVK